MPHKIKKTTKEFKAGTSGFKNRDQAIAAGLSMDRKAHKGTKAAPRKPKRKK